jgi:hypothetical protein
MKRWSIPLACLSVLSISVLAQQPPAPSAEVRQACHADVQKLCPGMLPGGGRIKECMQSHKADLSQGCRDALSKAEQQHAPPANGGQSPPAKPQ